MVCKFVTVTEFLFYFIYTDAQKKPSLKVIKLEYSLRLKINCNDWLLAGPQAANHCALF